MSAGHAPASDRFVIEEEGSEPELNDEDILDAMRRIPGYLDISTEDFRLIYRLAWRHALARLRATGANDAEERTP